MLSFLDVTFAAFAPAFFVLFLFLRILEARAIPRRPLSWRSELGIVLQALLAIGSVPGLPLLLLYFLWKVGIGSAVGLFAAGES